MGWPLDLLCASAKLRSSSQGTVTVSAGDLFVLPVAAIRLAAMAIIMTNMDADRRIIESSPIDMEVGRA